MAPIGQASRMTRSRSLAPGSRLTGLYLLVQGFAGGAWWLALWLDSSFRERFRPPGYDAFFILTYAPADLSLFVGGSFISAWLVFRRASFARIALAMTSGATLFAGLHCLGVALQTGGFWLPTLLMVPSAAFSLMLLLTFCPEDGVLPRFPFRTTRPTSLFGVLVRSTVQIVVFWGFFLGVVPAAIVWFEHRLGIPRIEIPSRFVAGGIVFAMGGGLGLWSAWHMASRGRGTPLPVSCPSRLVIAGPYRVVRNPMAIGGLAQGLGVAIALGSPLTVVYTGLGGIFWHLCVRPAEELDLVDRFGDAYVDYRNRVRCWIPSLRLS